MSNHKHRLDLEQVCVESFPTSAGMEGPAAVVNVAAVDFSTPNGCKLTRTGCSFMYCD